MKPYLLLYVTDVARSREWYERLGFQPRRTSRHGAWAELQWGDFLLFLHGDRQPRPAGFALPGFEAAEPLEALAERLAALNPDAVPEIVDEGFGRTLTLYDPDGYAWQINEHEPELYV